ncbi:MAG TPA: SDR family oxidoreductase [Atribacteraceae bacterium]|nr:SDR family oxidoreductase [Atribacteraceae bacterium]
MELGLKGKVAVITGGSVGIGLGLAHGFAREGAHVALCARSRERLEEAGRDLEKTYAVKCLRAEVDVTVPEAIDRFLGAVEAEFDGADILINNAGTGSAEKIMDAPDEKWQKFWDLHVMAAVRMSRGVVPMMRKRGSGVIINNASICARQPLDYEPIYNVTKAALVMFSKCLANELVNDHIRVNCVSPGLIMTPDWRKTATILSKDLNITPDEYLDRTARKYAPIGRFGTTEELSDFLLFLCSPRASYCVGSNYYVDGGWLSVTV